MEMYNPAHPGEVLKEFLDGLHTNVTAFAKHIGVSRVMLSRIVNGRAAITADMALRLAAALNDTPKIWLDMQTTYDLWQAKHNKHKKLPKIEKFPRAA